MEKSHDVTHCLIHCVADLRALSRYVVEVLELQLHERELRRNGVICRLVQETAQLLRVHVDQLDQELATLGEAESALRACTGHLAAAFVGFFSKARAHEPSRMLRDDSALLAFTSTSCLMLHTTALALRHPRTAQLAMTHYRELSALVQEMEQQLPRLVMADLGQHFGGIDRTAAETTSELASEVTPIQQPTLAATA